MIVNRGDFGLHAYGTGVTGTVSTTHRQHIATERAGEELPETDAGDDEHATPGDLDERGAAGLTLTRHRYRRG